MKPAPLPFRCCPQPTQTPSRIYRIAPPERHPTIISVKMVFCLEALNPKPYSFRLDPGDGLRIEVQCLSGVGRDSLHELNGAGQVLGFRID